MRVLFIEPFYGGSHRLFADRFAEHSDHEIMLLTLPASFWKWRLRGGHLSLLEKISGLRGTFDVLVTTDMLSLAELKGVLPWLAGVPSLVYFHENQLSYPVPKGEAPDVHFGFTNISTALAADGLVFNSRFHRREFLGGLETFLKAMPDHRPRRLAERVRPRARVVYPGVDCRELERLRPGEREARPLTILWNHRWEFDKGPESFFRVLRKLADDGLDFRVHLLGENFQVKPTPFLEARDFLGERLVTYGFLEAREDYVRALWDSDVVVSTAIHEFYGIAVMEAAYCGCRPLLPRRLSYPELYDEAFFYDDEEELEVTLRRFIAEGTGRGAWEAEQRERILAEHDVRRCVKSLDGMIESTFASRP
jgi:glycosyltransferase involved in cell wall biosynthesis